MRLNHEQKVGDVARMLHGIAIAVGTVIKLNRAVDNRVTFIVLRFGNRGAVSFGVHLINRPRCRFQKSNCFFVCFHLQSP